ncbi:MAG: phosphopantothenoylcysteine decarboxylase, partial [Sulfurimonadaceae bacterium]|nr:phosphopantothenoylcysteine decarboxylase [Sulfurimonadaceae bacterium]
YSSGKMASALAAALFLKGADVNLVSTRRESDLPAVMRTTDVESSSEMFEQVNGSIRTATQTHQEIQKSPYLFMAAAVSDYVPANAQEGKMKKEKIGERWPLELEENIDILKNLNKEGINTVAFKAEMDSETAVKNASAMIDKKDVDAVCLNLLKDSSSFGTTDNQIDFITAKEVISLPREDKLSLALRILEKAKEL